MPEIHHTTCVMDCPDACALEVEVEGGRVLRIGGRADGHPDTAGFICGKVAHFHRRLDHPERVLHPLRRIGPKGEGRFARIGWDEAVTAIAERLRRVRAEWGGEAIVGYHYGGSNGYLSDSLQDDLFFARLGASRLDRTICAAITTAVATAMYGKMPGVAFADYPRARAIIVWGANPRASNIHLVPYLRQARRDGAFVALVDPRGTLSPAEVDLHLPVLPGTDLPVALALAGEWERRGLLDRAFLERHARGVEPLLAAAREWPVERAARVAGVEAEAIRELARVFAARRPGVVRCGWGLERNRNGAGAVAGVLALPALAGKFGEPGGGYTLSNGGAYRLDRQRVIGALDWTTRRLNMSQLGRWLGPGSEPPVKALLVYNANPAATVPDQGAVLRGLAREDLFTVVSEQVMTDTALYADLVLPAATFLEAWDLRGGYGSYVAGGVRPVVEPAGEARSNVELFGALGRAMGFSDEAFTWSQEETFARVVAALEVGERPAALEPLARGDGQRVAFRDGGPVQFGDILPRTPDRRADLTPAALGGEELWRWQPPDERFPLALISPASGRLISSTLGESNLPRLELSLHPDEAGRRGLGDGEPVRIFNELGEVVCRLRLDPRLRPGVAALPKGAWRRSSLNGATSTALCPDHVNRVEGGACFNDARVEVERAAV